MPTDKIMSELLEFVSTYELKGRTTKREEIMQKMNLSAGETEAIISRAIENGYFKNDKEIRLTERGHLEVRVHREQYVHNRLVHRSNLTKWLERVRAGRIGNWREHWHKKHDLAHETIDNFYSDIRNLRGHIEDSKITCLTELHSHESGTIVFLLGGYGLVRRLSAMGLTKGVKVTVVRNAPFHGPVEIRLRDVSIALGYGAASKVYVKRTGSLI